jgi:hypothetical protein
VIIVHLAAQYRNLIDTMTVNDSGEAILRDFSSSWFLKQAPPDLPLLGHRGPDALCGGEDEDRVWDCENELECIFEESGISKKMHCRGEKGIRLHA